MSRCVSFAGVYWFAGVYGLRGLLAPAPGANKPRGVHRGRYIRCSPAGPAGEHRSRPLRRSLRTNLGPNGREGPDHSREGPGQYPGVSGLSSGVSRLHSGVSRPISHTRSQTRQQEDSYHVARLSGLTVGLVEQWNQAPIGSTRQDTLGVFLGHPRDTPEEGWGDSRVREGAGWGTGGEPRDDQDSERGDKSTHSRGPRGTTYSAVATGYCDAS